MPSFRSLLAPRPRPTPSRRSSRASIESDEDHAIVVEIVDRLERAFDCGQLDLTCRQYGLVLAAAFPEQFGDRPLPNAPTGLPIGTDDRVAVYAARAAAGQSLHHPDDARPDLLGRKNLTIKGIVNQTKFVVGGWDGDDADAA